MVGRIVNRRQVEVSYYQYIRLLYLVRILAKMGTQKFSKLMQQQQNYNFLGADMRNSEG